MAIIDDDALFARRVHRAFEGEGYEVECHDATAGIAAVRLRSFDLVVIDIGNSGERTDLCRRVRAEAARPDVPIIAATTNSDAHADALVAGADESVLKSVSMRELLARVSAVLRRGPNGSAEIAAYADPSVKIFPDTMRVLRNDQQIFLSKGEADVLALLMRHAPASLSVERIRQELADSSTSVTRSAIEARLKSLRKKIGSEFIANRIGYGYSFAPRKQQR